MSLLTSSINKRRKGMSNKQRLDRTKIKTVICKKCKGAGVVSHQELTDHHKCEYITVEERCPRCLGSGKLIKETEYRLIEKN